MTVRLTTSVAQARWNEPSTVGTLVTPATRSRFGVAATKVRSTRSGAASAPASWRVLEHHRVRG